MQGILKRYMSKVFAEIYQHLNRCIYTSDSKEHGFQMFRYIRTDVLKRLEIHVILYVLTFSNSLARISFPTNIQSGVNPNLGNRSPSLRIPLLAEVTEYPRNRRLQGPILGSCGFETRLPWTRERLFARDFSYADFNTDTLLTDWSVGSVVTVPTRK